MEKDLDIIFHQWIDRLEQQDFRNINGLFLPDVIFQSSAIGKAYGRNELICLLKKKKIKADNIKIRVFNNVVRNDGKNACQSAYLVAMISRSINGFMHIFQCGFLTMVEYSKENNNWLIKSYCSNMTFECGNSLIVANQWKLIDYQLFNGNHLSLTEKKEGPWKIKNCLGLTEEDKIKQCFFHYCWLIDTFSYDQLKEVYMDPYSMENEKLPGFENAVNIPVKQAISIFKQQRYQTLIYGKYKIPKEACWNHIAHFSELEVLDGRARATIYRYEPNRIGTRFIHKYNHNTIYYSGKWKIEFAKEFPDVWKISKYSFTNGIVEDKSKMDQSAKLLKKEKGGNYEF